MKLGIKRPVWSLLMGAVAICALLGTGASMLFRQYTSVLDLPNTLSGGSFKQVEPLLRSPAMLDKFISSSGLSADPLAQSFRHQILTGSGRQIRITREWAYSKLEMRNVPDDLVKTLIQNTGSDVQQIEVATVARTPETATKMAQLGMEFVRFALVYDGLTRSIEAWRNELATLSTLDSEILGMEWELESLDRQIAAIASLPETRRDVGASTGLANSSVQVQISGQAYLPVDQQLIGLRSLRIARTEQSKKKQEERERYLTIGKIADQIDDIRAEDPSSLQALAKAIALARRAREEGTSTAARQAADAVIRQLATMQEAYVRASTTPPQAFASASVVGPSLAVSTVIGAVVGVLGWMAICYVLLMWGPQIYLIRQKVLALGSGQGKESQPGASS